MSALSGLGEGLMMVGQQWQQRNNDAAAEIRDEERFKRKLELQKKVHLEQAEAVARMNAALAKEAKEALEKTPEWQEEQKRLKEERDTKAQREKESHESKMNLEKERARAAREKANRDARYVQQSRSAGGRAASGSRDVGNSLQNAVSSWWEENRR